MQCTVFHCTVLLFSVFYFSKQFSCSVICFSLHISPLQCTVFYLIYLSFSAIYLTANLFSVWYFNEQKEENLFSTQYNYHNLFLQMFTAYFFSVWYFNEQSLHLVHCTPLHSSPVRHTILHSSVFKMRTPYFTAQFSWCTALYYTILLSSAL